MSDKLQHELEKEVLGYLISASSKDLVLEILSKLEFFHFTDRKNKLCYEQIVEGYAKHSACDLIILKNRLEDKKLLNTEVDVFYLTELQDYCCGAYEIRYRVEKLIDNYKQNRLKNECLKAITKIQDGEDVSEISESLIDTIFKITSKQFDGFVNIPKTAEQIIQRADSIEKYGLYGYSWGLNKLDYMTNGIQRGKTYVAGATKKTGKTKFVLNSIYHLLKQDIKSLFLSLEMDGESVVLELLSRVAQVENNALKRKLSDGDATRLRSAIEEIANGKLLIDTTPFLSLNDIRLKIKSAAKKGVEVVFIDYLQRMDFQLSKNKDLNFATVIAQTVSGLADIAKENNVALIFLSQLNNDAERKQAGIEHLKDSGGIGEGVDCILILNNQDRVKRNYENKESEVWITVEQRSGQSGLVKCKVDLGKSMYLEIDTIHQQKELDILKR